MTKYFPYALTPDLAKRYKACLDEMQAIQTTFLEGTSENDMEFGLAMGFGNYYNYCKKAFQVAVKYPEYVGTQAHFTLAEFAAANDFSALWSDTAAQRQTIDKQKSLIEGLSGRAMTDKANHVHSKMKTDKKVITIKADYDELHGFFTARAEKTKSTKETNTILGEAKTIIEAKKKE
jgi:hypothetical protein